MGNNWWLMHEEELLSSLNRVSSGEDPSIILLELHANASVSQVDGDYSEWQDREDT